MRFRQEFYLGSAPLAPALVYGHVAEYRRVRREQVEAAAGYAGSCHVLEMGRHYSEYVRYRGQFPAFPRVAGIPLGHYMTQLDTKSRAPSVTGNVGEIVAALIARRALKFDLSSVAHLKTSNGAKTPDYLLRGTAEFEGLLTRIAPSLDGRALPPW